MKHVAVIRPPTRPVFCNFDYNLQKKIFIHVSIYPCIHLSICITCHICFRTNIPCYMACIVHSRMQNYIYARKTINTIKYNNYLVVFITLYRLMYSEAIETKEHFTIITSYRSFLSRCTRRTGHLVAFFARVYSL